MKLNLEKLFIGVAMLVSLNVYAQNVKVTFLGSHDGELCGRDRAMIFEDPSGVRILYDAGQSVTGGDDARLGPIHVVLLSHAHGDHIGDQKLKALNAGTCDKPETISASPNSTTGEIVAAKNAAIDMGSDMGAFIGRKVEKIKGGPVTNCAVKDDVVTVPLAAPCLATAYFGGVRRFKTAGSKAAVEVIIVNASHGNNVPTSLISEPSKTHLEEDKLSFALGPPTGYVVKFTNGLKVYLSGDTGIHTEMKSIMNDFHKVNLAVMNLGTSTGDGQSSAYAMNVLVQPKSVIVSHVNEAATKGGKLIESSKTAEFIKGVKGRPVYLSLSGKTLEFDGNAKCTKGCP